MRSSGLILIDKPEGVTSFGALYPIKKRLGRGIKVGHTGTLDKFASGLLVVCAGSYTRLAGFITTEDKSYEATILFGSQTDTLDPEGRVIHQAPLPCRDKLFSVIHDFTGNILQKPPLFSALHVKGERAYKRALRGEAVEMVPRPVTIHNLEITAFDGEKAVIRVTCSKGTYIRSLARDLALAAGSCGYLLSLRRTQLGRFAVCDAVAPELFDPDRHLSGGYQWFSDMQEHFAVARVDELMHRRITNGIMPPQTFLSKVFTNEEEGVSERHYLLFSEEGALAASLNRSEKGFAFDFVVGT
ncbi:tRNA pseudouridine(55) synthase TruB [Sediminispirochaeta smaragdinae]|uniref:tRNA pseudouridine synthase B n=1 Tax=Sediminispirochaeta smaragdinae (strain DSM 11293 / JCM 15392 / SEBR 4228) TaxID=573413 RepID=E1R1L1_SEDSS|nr:tRNA pseudouridine(55) synthase TruB [Sediminispirochaeta smaragdinae]ADK81152.1 tRNA pseudouridine synthase B [Sediminispirochaeta smaragdinae DSM 11293]